MNFFVNQGRCRVCAKICCCSSHQKEHEFKTHKEYTYLLEKLPMMCKKCHRKIYSVSDLHSDCHPFLDKFLMNGTFNTSVSFIKPNRKRTIKEITQNKNILTVKTPVSSDDRKKLSPVYKFKSLHLKTLAQDRNSPQMYFIGINEVITEADLFSPQLNVSYKFLSKSVIKASTPINDTEKENSPLITQCSNTVNVTEKSIYMTPEVVHNSVVLISSSRKNDFRNLPNQFKPNSDVTIDISSPAYFTPPTAPSSVQAINLPDRFRQSQNLTIDISSPSYYTPPSSMGIIDEIEIHDNATVTEQRDKTPSRHLFVKIAKRMRTAINRLPGSVSDVWDWSRINCTKTKINTDKLEADDFRSPVKKRAKFDTDQFLQRKPIKSYWVNMSVNSLIRKPLPNYIDRYYPSAKKIDYQD